MKPSKAILICSLTAMWSHAALAEVTCTIPSLAVTGGSWDLFCSDDGSQETDYVCNVSLGISTQFDDTTNELLINGLIEQNQKNVPLWFAARYNEQNITNVTINNVDCDAQED